MINLDNKLVRELNAIATKKLTASKLKLYRKLTTKDKKVAYLKKILKPKTPEKRKRYGNAEEVHNGTALYVDIELERKRIESIRRKIKRNPKSVPLWMRRNLASYDRHNKNR